jgi:hypothetical protein
MTSPRGRNTRRMKYFTEHFPVASTLLADSKQYMDCTLICDACWAAFPLMSCCQNVSTANWAAVWNGSPFSKKFTDLFLFSRLEHLLYYHSSQFLRYEVREWFSSQQCNYGLCCRSSWSQNDRIKIEWKKNKTVKILFLYSRGGCFSWRKIQNSQSISEKTGKK